MSESTSYTVPPPGYNTANKFYGSSEQQHLTGNHSSDIENAYLNEEAEDNNWKIGVTVSQSSAEVRHAFVRKVYGLLFIQILGTTLIGAVMRTDSARMWILENSWAMWLSMGGSFVSLFGLYWKAHSHPTNLIILAVFTLFESFLVGSVVSFYDQTIVLQALIITLFVFAGLTLFTLQSKFDFSSLGPWLFAVLLIFFATGIVGIFFPFSKTVDAVYAGLGVLLFSAYLLYDTHMIMNRLSVDDVVLAVVSLYLDLINLFLMILRLLNNVENR